jgi:hypothetical protein
MENEPKPGASFDIEGPDENGLVWLTHRNRPASHIYLGEKEAVAEKLCQWLSIMDYGECA